MKTFILSVALLLMPAFVFGNDLVDRLQEVSVTIQTNEGQGSGVIRTRKIGDTNVNFVLTAAHVVDSLRKVRDKIDVKTGTTKKVVEYDDARVVQTINENGRLVAHYMMLAKVVKISTEEDLAVLQIRKLNFTTASAKMYLENKVPSLGDDVWNVGSALGIEGSNTVSKGIISHTGRILQSYVYDQVSCPGFPGCSGSGVYLNDGRMMGLLVRGAGETFILVVPARRINDWARRVKMEWVVNDNVPVPSIFDLDKIPVE